MSNRDGPEVVGGGDATAGGVEYQACFAASVAVAMLSGGTISAWNLTSSTRIEFVWCEAPQVVDDLNAGLSNGGVVYIQAKRSLSLDAQFRSAIDQFVRQFLSSAPVDPARPWQRSFDRVLDRLVLAAGRDSSSSILIDLRRVLDRIRDAPAHVSLHELKLSEREWNARTKLIDAVTLSWTEHLGHRPSTRELRELATALYVQRADVESGGAEEDVTRDRLAIGVVADRSHVQLAWNTLVAETIAFARQRGGATADQLRHRLLDAGIRLIDHSSEVHISGARIHEICREALPRQIDRVGGDKYIREMFVPRRAMRRLDALLEVETSFRRNATALLDRLRLAAEHAQLAGGTAAIVAFVRELETTASPRRLLERLRRLKVEFRHDATSAIAAQVQRTIREKDDDRFRAGVFRVLELLDACDVAQYEPPQTTAERLAAGREDIARNTMPALNGLWHRLPCVPSKSFAEPAVLASSLLDDLSALINTIARRSASITGAAGHGKTNALCALAENIIEHDPVIVINGVMRFTDDLTIERVVTQTLSPSPLPLNSVGTALARSGHRLWVMIDTLDQTPDHVTAAQAIERFLIDTADLRINVVIGCRDTFWPYFQPAMQAHLAPASPIVLSQFEDGEWGEAMERYLARYEIHCRLEPAAEEKLRNPLLLHFFCMTNRGKDLGTIRDLRPLDVFDHYVKRSVQDIARRREKLDASSGIRLLENIAAKMWELRVTALPLEDSGIDEDQRESATSMYSDLKAAAILREECWDEDRQPRSVRFTYDELHEYMLGRGWNTALDKDARSEALDELVGTAVQKLDLPPTMGALVFLQRMRGSDVLRRTIARILTYGETFVVQSQGVILLALRNLPPADAPEEIKALLYMLQSRASSAVRDEIAPVVLALLERQPSDADFRRMAGRILGVDLDIALIPRGEPVPGTIPPSDQQDEESALRLPAARHRYSRTARLNALAAIARHGQDEDVSILMEAMARMGQSQMNAALEAFRSIDNAADKIVFTLIERFVVLPFPEYRVYSCWLLRKRYGADAARLILRLLLDEDTRVHRYVFRQFRRRDVEPELFEATVARLTSDMPIESWHARNLIDLMMRCGRAASTTVIPILASFARSQNLSLRIRSLGHLAEMDPTLARAIATAEQDPEIEPLLVRAATSSSDMGLQDLGTSGAEMAHGDAE